MAAVSSERLAHVFVEVADTLVDDFDLLDFLHVLTKRTTEVVGSAAAGLLLADRDGRLQVMAASAERALLLQLLEAQSHEGPCHDAYRSGRAVLNADLATTHPRWPAFSRRAVEAGYRSVHAFPLRLRSDVIGALNLFDDEAGQFSPDDVVVAQALADVATIGILQERSITRGELLTEQLNSALTSRVVIEQAKGVVAQSYGVDVSQAFDLIRAYARRNNRRLSDVAQTVVRDSDSLDLSPE